MSRIRTGGMSMNRFLDVLNCMSFESQGDIVMTETFERVVPEDASVQRERENVAVAAGVDNLAPHDDGDIFISRRAQNAGLEFRAPDFGAGLDINRRDVAVASDVKNLVHTNVLTATRCADDYKWLRKFYLCIALLFCALTTFAKQQ